MTIGPRYVVTWNNGTWKIFDRVLYGDVDIFDSEKAAKVALESLTSRNNNKKQS